MTIAPESLRASRLLSDLSYRDLRRLAGTMRERQYEPGTPILTEGEGGVGFFVLLEGAAEVRVGTEARGTLSPGDWFGEIALLDSQQQRTASVVATAPTTCATLTAWEFKPFLAEHPDAAWQLMRSLAQRIADDRAYVAAHAPDEGATAQRR
jgi:CRP-like cAMP-binding protein